MSHEETPNLIVVLDCHRRSKHHLQRYADGPGTIDRDSQHDLFRHFAGAAQFKLPLPADTLTSSYRQLYTHGAIPPAAFTQQNLGGFFQLSFAFSAWRQYGSTRCSLRCNPPRATCTPPRSIPCCPMS